MDVQWLFYFLGSIFMLLGIALLITTFVLFFIVVMIVKKSGQRIDELLEQIAKEAEKMPTKYLMSTGMFVASALFKKFRKRSSE